jgi:hypothetical protein
MNVKSVSKNAPQRVFYKDAYLRTNRTVRFSAWSEFGSSLFLDVNYSVQIPNSGVYYYDFTTPNINGYVLIIATDGSDPQGSILRVGSPSEELAFYLRGDLAENITTNYEIFDINSAVIASGTMENVSSGFYKVNVDGLIKPWFLEVNETVVVESV